MTVLVQSYRNEVDLPSSDEGLDEIEKREVRLRAAGFTGLISARQTLDSMGTAQLLYGELRGPELGLWRRFLPKAYVLSAYAYDDVPDEVVGLIKSAQDLGVFTRIDVWTPEGNTGREQAENVWSNTVTAAQQIVEDLTDPMAVGVIALGGKEHFFPIARWGESLLEPQQIASFLRRQAVIRWTLTLLPVAIVLGLAIGAFVSATMVYSFGTAVCGTFATLAVLVVTIRASIGLRDRRARRNY